MLNEPRLDGFSRLACINPPGPTHINSEYICTVYNTLTENCCPPIMEKRLSYKKPKPHHFYTFLVGMCNTVPWLLMCHYFQLLKCKLMSVFKISCCWVVNCSWVQLVFFYNIVLARMYGGIRSWVIKWLKKENGGHEIQSPDARKYNVRYYCSLILLSQAVSL